MINRILVPIDAGRGNKRQLLAAKVFAQDTQATVDLVHFESIRPALKTLDNHKRSNKSLNGVRFRKSLINREKKLNKLTALMMVCIPKELRGRCYCCAEEIVSGILNISKDVNTDLIVTHRAESNDLVEVIPTAIISDLVIRSEIPIMTMTSTDVPLFKSLLMVVDAERCSKKQIVDILLKYNDAYEVFHFIDVNNEENLSDKIPALEHVRKHKEVNIHHVPESANVTDGIREIITKLKPDTLIMRVSDRDRMIPSSKLRIDNVLEEIPMRTIIEMAG